MNESGFRFAYDPGVIRHGRGCVADLAAELAALDCERALVVCGRTVGSTPAVIEPIREGLGDRLAGVFDETTPEKRVSTAVEGAQRMAELGADALVAVGGGSSLDIAKAISAVAASAAPPANVAAQFGASGTLPVPEGDLPPIAAVPTTLAGADLSILAGLTAHPDSDPVDEPVEGGVGDPRLMPAALFYDPALVETTPREILAASAMNGFNKGVETLYAANATPITDGTAIRGLSLLSDALPTLSGDPDSWATGDVLGGIVLVQYGISRPGGTTLSLLHAFGHGLTANSDIQQGAAHAIVTPHALRYLFEGADGRRELLADAFGIDAAERSSDAVGEAIVEEVTAVRDSLDLPTRLREVEDLSREDLDAVAADTAADSLMGNCPPGLDPTAEELRNVLDAAW
jgi:alcohol dehydrogenase